MKPACNIVIVLEKVPEEFKDLHWLHRWCMMRQFNPNQSHSHSLLSVKDSMEVKLLLVDYDREKID